MSVRIAYWSPSFTSPIATPATAPLSVTARIHQRKACTADRGHRRRTVRLQNVGDDAEGIWRLVRRREDRRDRTLSQSSVTHFATPDTGHAPGFANGKWREVVVQHEALLLLAFVGLQPLLVIRGAECDGDQRLCLPTSEERRTVGAGQYAGFDRDLRESRQTRGDPDESLCFITCSRKMRSRSAS